MTGAALAVGEVLGATLATTPAAVLDVRGGGGGGGGGGGEVARVGLKWGLLGSHGAPASGSNDATGVDKRKGPGVRGACGMGMGVKNKSVAPALSSLASSSMASPPPPRSCTHPSESPSSSLEEGSGLYHSVRRHSEASAP